MLTQDDLRTGLQDPDAYPWIPGSVETIETHISWIFVAGNFVLKIKKAVNYGFIDHNTLEKRHKSCIEEIRLNSRLTSDVYLKVVPVVQRPNGFKVDEDGTPVEWGILMRRLPESQMLNHLIQESTFPNTAIVDRLAEKLIPFHMNAVKCGALNQGSDSSIDAVVMNLDQLAPFLGSPLAFLELKMISENMRQILSTEGSFFAARMNQGWIRDGHGDLRTDHICIEDEESIQVIDCLEFNAELRCADIASDLSTLLVDFDSRSAHEASCYLLELYREAGIDLPDKLILFYQAHRALVAAKIACLKSALAATEQQEAPNLVATDFLHQAFSYNFVAESVLIIMSGLSGTGKSTLASSLARALGVKVYSSDMIRKTMKPSDAWTGQDESLWGLELYDPYRVSAVYDHLISLAEEELFAGRAVILDATFLDTKYRDRAKAMARSKNIPLVLVHLECNDQILLERIRRRSQQRDRWSDATEETLAKQKEAYSDTSSYSECIYVRIDTSSTENIDVDPVLRALFAEKILVPRQVS